MRYWSDKVFRIHGEDPRSFEPSYEEALDYYHKDDLENVKAHVNQVMENGGKFHFQHRLINRQGETISVEAFGLARPNAQGEVNRIIGVFRALD